MQITEAAIDAEQVIAAATDYLTSFYTSTGDAEQRTARIKRVLHVELAKRSPCRMENEMFLNWSYGEVCAIAEREHGGNDPFPYSATLLDLTPRMASVRTDAAWGVDYVHLAKLNGEWKVVNVLWDDVR
jgi:Putative lumazine-binding